MEKRGQVSLFIVIGIVLLVVVGFLFYVGSFEKIDRVEDIFEVEPVKKEIEDCLKDGVLKVFEKVYKNSGYLKGGVRNLCRPSGEDKYRLVSEIEIDVSDELKDLTCEVNDFDVKIEDVEVFIKDKEVNVDVEIEDVIIGKGDNEVVVNSFNFDVPLRFGELYQSEWVSGDDSWVYKIVQGGNINDFIDRARENKFFINKPSTSNVINIQDLNNLDWRFKFEC